MAAIDSLLTLIDAQQATGIVLRAREAPVLMGGKGRGLTMPPLDRATIEIFAGEVLTPEEYERLDASGSCEQGLPFGAAGELRRRGAPVRATICR